ncbi:MAG: hypothetical protein IJX48_00330 [Paludibacteraceae bacterium]|nr:hypothetical protein [Paludibacteraceae bacterium]
MLQYNNWSIEQGEWLPMQESDFEQQLTFSNGYLCQTAHFEEHYSGEQRLCTYIKGVEIPILNISAISVRLHDERLDLAQWRVEQFSRTLHKNEALLEREFVATSPNGHTLHVTATRRLLADKKEMMQLVYRIQSINYEGPMTILSLLRGGEDADRWYSLMNHVDDSICWQWSQLPAQNVQVCCAMNYHLTKNGVVVDKRPIKVEKQEVIGFSVTQSVKEGDVFELTKNVVVQDSLHNHKDLLIANTVSCLTNW